MWWYMHLLAEAVMYVLALDMVVASHAGDVL